jgi:hypothetical protein
MNSNGGDGDPTGEGDPSNGGDGDSDSGALVTVIPQAMSCDR